MENQGWGSLTSGQCPDSMAPPRRAPDGGWGWMVVLAAFLQTALVFGVIRSWGVFFVEFVAYFGGSSSAVSWVLSLGVTVLQFASPVGSALSGRFGARPVVMVGGLLSGLGLLLASFSASLAHLYLSVGLLTGLGWALVFTPSMAAVSHYFEKRRTLATGLAVSGAGVSSLVFSPLFQYLVDLYGWRGALRMVAGLSLNLVVSGALLRPLEGAHTHTDKAVVSSSWLGTLSSLLGLELLHHGPFMCYILVLILVDAGYFVPYAHLVAHAREVGCDEYQAAFLMAAAAVADMCGRIFAGGLADSGAWGRPLHHLTLWTVLTGLSLALIPLGCNYTSRMALGICYGLFAGAVVPLQFTSLVEIVGPGYMLEAIGLMHMLESIGALLGTPLSGWLRDITGNFTASFITAGAFLLAGGLILGMLPNSFSRSRPPEATEENSQEPQDCQALELRRVPLPKNPETFIIMRQKLVA
ncbi:monocarboxylate transporter 13-like [Hemicordylus capensis]|uniref:monocarboxylate transporter 13-like n=1 Tax=Hemicordylus capensis TaxID=884348 RepID=UPI00230497FC|nr:monocarboxylate transporter 13-like [Hemicordylus capensis]